jgi:hypothetical protein
MNKAFLIVAVFAAVVLAAGPSGDYCGSYNGIVTGKGDFTSSTSANLNINIFGSDTNCPGEAYTYDASTGVIDFPGATNPSDCLGALLSSYGITLTATYDSSANSISLVTSVATINLTPCS